MQVSEDRESEIYHELFYKSADTVIYSPHIMYQAKGESLPAE